MRRGEAHEYSGMLEHVKGTLWLRRYEESKEMHGNSSAAVNLCRMIIAAPQLGQCQTESSQAGGDGSLAA